MITLKINNVIYVDEESNFSICRAKIIDGLKEIPDNVRDNVRTSNKQIVIKGYFPQSTKLNLQVEGDWQKSKYGYQLSVTSFTEVSPTTEEGIVAYLSSLVYGLQEKSARRIVDHFGLRTIEIFESNPEELLNVRGIGRKKLEKIINSFNATRSMQDIVSFLVPFGVSPNKCVKVAQAFGGNAMSIIREEPFRLCDIDGFGFLTVDSIAKHTTFDLKDPLRIKGAIKYVLESAMNEGHLCEHQARVCIESYLLLNGFDIKKESIKNIVNIFLKENDFSIIKNNLKYTEVVSFKDVKSQFKIMALDYTIKGDNGYAYLSSVYEQEVESADIISQRLQYSQKTFPEEAIRKEIAKQEKLMGIKLATKQVEAVILGVNNNTAIITGGPGVGKTTVLKVVLKVCEKFLRLTPANVTLLAPTGRAAQRMAESVGDDYTASTIHSCLQIGGDGMGAYEPIDSKIVVVDEASMVDQYICWCLLNAVPTNTKLIFIGDAEQLPSVGAGNVLYELLRCKEIPTVRLDVIYRQNGTSPVVINSDFIKKGVTNLKYDSNFQFVKVQDKSDIGKKEDYNKIIQNETADIVVEQFMKAVSEKGLDDVQVLCPIKKDKFIASAAEINRRIQAKINPSSASAKKAEIKRGKTTFRTGDKVILTKNNYELEWRDKQGHLGEGLFNGDIGYIKRIDKSDNKVLIDFCGKEACLDITQMVDIELAYAISIHKSQGSEYQTVIIPIISAFTIMLKRNLIYTGITRAKKQVILVGHQKAIEQSINTNVISKRNTQLGKRIKENLEAVRASA